MNTNEGKVSAATSRRKDWDNHQYLDQGPFHISVKYRLKNRIACGRHYFCGNY
jgi:hypothetical protein